MSSGPRFFPRPPTLEEAETFQGGGCPFCHGREFHEGPRGGAGVNWDCLTCGALFVVGPVRVIRQVVGTIGHFWPVLLEVVRGPMRSNAANLAEGGHKPAPDPRHGKGAGPLQALQAVGELGDQPAIRARRR